MLCCTEPFGNRTTARSPWPRDDPACCAHLPTILKEVAGRQCAGRNTITAGQVLAAEECQCGWAALCGANVCRLHPSSFRMPATRSTPSTRRLCHLIDEEPKQTKLVPQPSCSACKGPLRRPTPPSAGQQRIGQQGCWPWPH